MGTKKTPHLRQGGTATKKKAENFARWIVRELDGDPAAMHLASDVISLLATQERRNPRRSD